MSLLGSDSCFNYVLFQVNAFTYVLFIVSAVSSSVSGKIRLRMDNSAALLEEDIFDARFHNMMMLCILRWKLTMLPSACLDVNSYLSVDFS